MSESEYWQGFIAGCAVVCLWWMLFELISYKRRKR